MWYDRETIPIPARASRRRRGSGRAASVPAVMSNYKQPHNAKIPEGDFINLFETLGPHKLARKLGYKSVRSVFGRREAIEQD
jgi:hypothetical protein